MAQDTEQSRSEIWDEILDGCDAKMSRDEFWVLFCGLFDGRGVKRPSADQGRIWYIALSDLDRNQFLAAIGRYLQFHSKEYLSIELIRELGGVQGTAEDRSQLAWADVRQAIRTHGAYRSVLFDDPQINYAIHAMGGWVELCDTRPDELQSWTAKRFRDLYQAAVRNGVGRMERLPGIVEKDNWSRSRRTSLPSVAHIETTFQQKQSVLLDLQAKALTHDASAENHQSVSGGA